MVQTGLIGTPELRFLAIDYNIHVLFCTYVRMWVCMYVCMECLCMYGCMYVCIYGCMYVCMFVRAHHVMPYYIALRYLTFH